MSEKDRGLYEKYYVERVDGKDLKGGQAIVLEVGDPNSWPALAAYAETVRAAGYEFLGDDIYQLIAENQMQ